MTDPPGAVRHASRLARLSFADGARAAELLAGAPLSWWDLETNEPVDASAAVVVAALARTADPDAALAALARLLAAPGCTGLREELEQRADLRARLLGLLGVSGEIAAHLVDHPEQWRVLVDDIDTGAVARRLHDAVRADVADPVTGTGGTRARCTGPDAIDALRTAYRREVVAIAGRDVAGDLDVRAVTEMLADLAGHTLQAALAVAATSLAPDAPCCRLAVIAMGKAGSRELNYVSDVDVVYVVEPLDEDDDVEPALGTGARLAAELMRVCRAVAWEVDPNLRPEGKDGPLVRTLASHEAYYRRWAKTWEFQALLKARPIAGDLALGRAYSDVIAPLVWTAAERQDFVADVRAMRSRVVEHIPVAVAERDIKLGRGGIRDVEFAVQLLQLVHGRGDETLRSPETLPALDALRNGGYVGRDDAVSLVDAYRFLRTVEHRLQLRRLRRTHILPDRAADLGWLARSMGYRPDHRGTARDVFDAEWKLHAREVRRLHEKLFYRPLLEAVARVPAHGLRLTTAEAGRRLEALGFDNPDAALRHIESLTSGLSRRAALQRGLLPVLLADFASAPAPDTGLLAYRTLSDQLGTTPWYLRLLRDGDAVAQRLAHILGTSRYVAPMLGRAPEALRLLADDDALRPGDPVEVLAAMNDVAGRQPDAAAAVRALRAVRRQELLRTAFADLLGRADVEQVCDALSTTLAATLQATVRVALRSVAEARGLAELPIRFAVIAMGRLGGGEVGYGSDADVLFVFENVGDATAGGEELATNCARDVAGSLRALLGAASSTDPPLVVDAGLRPEGRNGALVRSLASYRAYYARWSSAWEAQALLRARPVAGDDELGRQFVSMIDPVRYPEGGVAPDDLVEIRRLKGRIDSERLPRGADPTTHTKLGRGGLADIEWTVQLLQLDHGHALPELRTTRTLAALDALAKAGLLESDQAEVLRTAWRCATRVRNALVLVRDKPTDQLPALGAELVAVSRVMGYPLGSDPGQLVDDYRRAARRARKVVEDVFYGGRG
ncbi:glutamate-ammonia-ligase adenylyltransferase [Jatrophihabitans endophyticus]|uniref:Bifunctional glutamine synthetase adenylyltransferase/adenylyl-removing enzyme n=1 Tax=Jatrophihabitans endophyticus TaxID=1206085 RepID=A0A1M5KVS7_9ACTN|nr:bifunctional [glutamine synthetase] adenylyltransferase/[glutamine synthetase]-adenylyl-L-tyrosine phosphorylase [Jatrophihabitans endophyticus]SHG56914.1 glutamate-ammonia-ligase adenylyltransferase [Jatrophihabitans endophyticus]